MHMYIFVHVMSSVCFFQLLSGDGPQLRDMVIQAGIIPSLIQLTRSELPVSSDTVHRTVCPASILCVIRYVPMCTHTVCTYSATVCVLAAIFSGGHFLFCECMCMFVCMNYVFCEMYF